MVSITIRTGFAKISHNIEFQPASIEKGKNLCKAEHVRNVEEFRNNGVSYLIKGKVIRQTSVTAPAYTTQLSVNTFFNSI